MAKSVSKKRVAKDRLPKVIYIGYNRYDGLQVFTSAEAALDYEVTVVGEYTKGRKLQVVTEFKETK